MVELPVTINKPLFLLELLLGKPPFGSKSQLVPSDDLTTSKKPAHVL